MKKLLLLLFCLMLTMTAACAEEYTGTETFFPDLGFSLVLPEGYEPSDLSERGIEGLMLEATDVQGGTIVCVTVPYAKETERDVLDILRDRNNGYIIDEKVTIGANDFFAYHHEVYKEWNFWLIDNDGYAYCISFTTKDYFESLPPEAEKILNTIKIRN